MTRNSAYNKLTKDSQSIVDVLKTYLQEFVTEVICKKIEEKNAEIEALREEVSTLKSNVQKLEEITTIQKFELDDIKHASNKDFLIMSGTGITHSPISPQSSVQITLKNKIGADVSLADITEASKLPAKKTSDGNPKFLLKFKLPYATKTSIISKLAEKKPDIYINEALSPLKRDLLTQARAVKKALKTRIKSVYFKNGVLRINEVNGTSPVKVLNQIGLNEYLKKINFNTSDLRPVQTSEPEETRG